MIQLTNEQLYDVEGGFNITGTLISSVSGMIRTVFDLGRNFGSAIRRIGSNKMCSL